MNKLVRKVGTNFSKLALWTFLFTNGKTCKEGSKWGSGKVHIFWEGHKNFAKSSTNFWPQYIQSKVSGRFRKILWPSQNIWTLQIKSSKFEIWIAIYQQFDTVGELSLKIVSFLFQEALYLNIIWWDISFRQCENF